MKKLLAIVLSLLMVMSLAVPAMAAEGGYSITIDNTANENVTIKGRTFNAYKIFDVEKSADGSTYEYTIKSNSEWYNDVNTYITAHTDSQITLQQKGNTVDGVTTYVVVYKGESGDESIARGLANDLVRQVTGKTVSGSVNVPADNATETATIPLTEDGYYLVTGKVYPEVSEEGTEEVVAAAALTNAAPASTVKVKAEAPDIDKKIVEGEAKVEANDAKVGDTVDYEITSHVPDMRGYKNYAFIVTDTLSAGLDYNSDIAVKIGDDTLAADAYTVTTSGKTEIKVIFKNFIQYLGKYDKGTPITITYSATINKDAVIGEAGNPNTVKLTYSNNPNEDGEGDWNDEEPNTPTGDTPEEIVKTYLTGIRITKKDGNTDEVLKGAEFTISGEALKKVLVKEEKFVEDNVNGNYWLLTDGTYTTDDPNTPGMDQTKYASTTTKYRRDVETKILETSETIKDLKVTSDTTGLVSFEGLSEGTYTINEVKTLDGYNLLTDPITVVITSDIDTQLKDKDLTAADNCVWNATATLGPDSLTLVNNNGVFEFDVDNNKGTQLPETGGIGTTIFYVVGGLMMTVAVVLLVTKKKVSGR